MSNPSEQFSNEHAGAAAAQAVSRIVAYGNPEKPGLGVVLRALGFWAEQHHVELSVAREIAPALESSGVRFQVYEQNAPSAALFDAPRGCLLVSLGGDGTLIRAVRRFWPIEAPVLSVNLGSLGFNSSVEPERVTDALDAWERGEVRISERMTVRVRWIREGATLAETMAMNDVVLLKEYEARMIHFSLRQGGAVLSSFAADGLILATPTGSTAYNLSAGGPIIFPTLPVLAATAICPHTLTARPMLLPPTPPVIMEFELRHSRDKGLLWIDGQERWPVAQGDCIAVEAEPHPLRLIASDAGHYFATLRRKLCWSGEPQVKGAPGDGKFPGSPAGG